MRVLQFREFGGPSQLEIAERPLPQADSASALVRIEAASINPSDVKNVAGKMSQTTLPRVPGRDYSGVVTDGPEAWIGHEVWGTGGEVGFIRDGTHAEYILVPRASLTRKPQRLSHEQAATAGVTFLTAWLALVEVARLAKGEFVVIMGSTGGVGSAAVQIARQIGARVIGVNRTVPPATTLADHLFAAADTALATQVRSVTAGRGAEVVFNAAGGPMFGIGLGLLAHRGRQVEITSPTERTATLDVVDFYHNESQLFGLDTLKRDLTAAARILERLQQGFDEGVFQTSPIADVCPLSEAPAAYARVAAGEHGRVVLKPSLG